MGSTQSSVTSGVKAQANAAVEMYSLVDLNGGGELVELMKKATKTKDYNELDETIRSKIGKYVMTGGQGKCEPIHKFILRRNKERPPTKQITPPKNLPNDETVASKYIPGEHDPSLITDHKTYRFQCWSFEHLGAVGETALHLCVLNATSVHNDLAKRVIRHFPALINDVYLCDEYYGENVLHIAIVNEDPSMVKFLLDNGANYHERCIGNFMCAEDQKNSRNDSLDHEWVDLNAYTNYSGYVYWGEYPLSFAACLGQEECYRLILAKGASPDIQDTNGNTVVHMMVIYDKFSMFDMAFELGGSIGIPNRQGMIPSSLAASMARRDLFFHILNIEREIYWQIGNVTCAAYPLDYLDTINTKTGETEKKSALNLITYGQTEAHLDLMEGPIVDLLKTKWETFVKFRFYRLFFIFLIYFLISLGAYVLRPVPCKFKTTPKKTERSASVFKISSLGITCQDISVLTDPNLHRIEKELNTSNVSISAIDFNSSIDEESEKLTESKESRHKRDANYPNVLKNITEIDLTNKKPKILPTFKYLVGEDEEGVTITDFFEETNKNSELFFNCQNSTRELILEGQGNMIVITSAYKKSSSDQSTPTNDIEEEEEYLNETIKNTSALNPCTCYLWKLPKPLENDEFYILGGSWTVISYYIRIICEGLTLLGSLAYLFGAGREARFQGLRTFFKNLSTIPARFLFLFACCLVIVMAILRFCCMEEAEDLVAVMAMVCTGPYFLFFCRGFKTVGPMVTMIYTMLVGDLLRFVTIYFVFIMGFSQAYYVLFSSYYKSNDCSSNPLSSPMESIMAMFIMSLGNFGDLYDAFSCTDHEITSKIMFLIFIAIVSLLLINLLIAMMGNTYQIIAEMKNEWMRQWARIVLVVERGLSPEIRLQKLLEYSQPMSDGRRALVLRLHQDEEEREEMNDILEMKRVHKKYVERRKKKIKEIEERNRKVSAKIH